MKPYKFIISGGGTGGHIYPAIAIANELKQRYPDAQFLFVGAQDRMEMEKVPNAGYDIQGLWISGIQRKLTLSNLSFPLKLITSVLKSKRILQEFKPNVAIGTGGYASGPLLIAASRMGVSTLIQEQNSFPGITNKLLAKKADKVCVAYANLERFFPKEKIVLTGNPVRKDLLTLDEKRQEAIAFFGLKENKKTILVLGGSLGARRINELIESHIKLFEDQEVQLIWQCGKLYHEQYEMYDTLMDVQVHAFLNKMDLAYAAADIIISRAGAISVSELSIVGKPVVFIPSPNVSEDHQTKNAAAVVAQDAAILIKEVALDEEFKPVIASLIGSQEKCDQLGSNIKQLAKVNATNAIVDEIEKLLKQ